MSVNQEKQELREQMLAERARMPVGDKKRFDNQICKELTDIVDREKYKSVHCYLPMGNEVDVTPFIESLLKTNITVICPKTLRSRQLEHLVLHSLNDLEDGKFGTKHPAGSDVYTGKIDLIVVPGLAFDSASYRLGYGAGYYDNFLSQHPESFKIGVCYPYQMIDKVPVEAHDEKLDDVMRNA